MQKFEPTVHILLASYQGEAYLAQQLESIQAQTFKKWTLLVSDDGSTDRTSEIVADFARNSPQPVCLVNGPRQGVTHNFFHLMNTVQADSADDLYAFCDQDDVWLPDKLAKAVLHYSAQTLKAMQPYLFCSQTVIVDQQLTGHKTSPVPRKPLGFGNALLQNIASGNTMIFNEALLKILRLISPQNSVLHDWTAYQAVTGCGGVVHLSHESSLLYRQHRANVVGSNTGLISRMRRLRFMLQGGHKRWSFLTITAMHQVSPRLTPNNLALLQAFEALHSMSNPYRRVSVAVHGKFWRQSRLGHASFVVALLLNLV